MSQNLSKYSKDIVTDSTRLFCSRKNNLFYSEIYEDLLKKSIILIHNNNGETYDYNTKTFTGNSIDFTLEEGSTAMSDLNKKTVSFNNLNIYLNT